jgi:hypothetical protein
VPAVPLQVVAFFVEPRRGCTFDSVTVNSLRYCGFAGPFNVVPADGKILWLADESITAPGWEICWGPQLP